MMEIAVITIIMMIMTTGIVIAKKRGKKEIYWANLINNYWTRFEKKAEKLKKQ